MCGCTLPIVDQSSLPKGIVGMKLNDVLKSDFASLLAWAWCINPDKVNAAFKSDTGMDITSADLARIVNAHMNGSDKSAFNVDFKDVISKIKFTPDEVKKSECKVNLVR